MMKRMRIFSFCQWTKYFLAIGFIYLLPRIIANELLSSGTPPKKYIVTEPGLGLWNQLMSISCAMVMANFTGRNLYINGIKPDYQFGNTVEASKLIDLDHLTHSVAPKMGIRNPNFTIADFNNRTFIPQRCVRKSKLHDNSITVYEWIKKVDVDCEIIDIGFSFFDFKETKAEHLFYLSEHISSIYRFIQFNQQIMDLSKYLQQHYVSNCQNALVIHYRIEDDLLRASWSPFLFHFKSNDNTNITQRNEFRSIIAKGFVDLTHITLDKFPTKCVYICTNAEEVYLHQFKNQLLEKKPHLVIVHNPLNSDRLLHEEPRVKAFAKAYQIFNSTSSREIRGAIDFTIANNLGGSFIGAYCSTFSRALASRFIDKQLTVNYVETYIDAVHRNRSHVVHLKSNRTVV